MKGIKRKLNNNGGASLLIAMVGFLAATMISIVIVSAAITATKRVGDDRAANQAHLTLASAAQIVESQIEGTEYTFDSYTKEGKISGGSASGTFQKEMKLAVEEVDASGQNYPSDAFTITSDVSGVEKVNGSFIMKADTNTGNDKYDLVFTLSLDGSQQTVYLSVDGNCDNTKQADGKYHITWSAISINELG